MLLGLIICCLLRKRLPILCIVSQCQLFIDNFKHIPYGKWNMVNIWAGTTQLKYILVIATTIGKTGFSQAREKGLRVTCRIWYKQDEVLFRKTPTRWIKNGYSLPFSKYDIHTSRMYLDTYHISNTCMYTAANPISDKRHNKWQAS